MQTIPIFRPGAHRAASGDEITFSEADLQASVDAYDPALHEAPLVVGHPKDNAPAYGWVSGLGLGEDGHMEAQTTQVDPSFAELVEAGRYKKRSASFYSPNSPNNPKPGVYYLRHVGFLGAQPPSIKGLPDVNFSEQEEGVVEFADEFLIANLFRRVREWLIEKHGTDTADDVIPGYAIEDLEEEGRMRREQDKEGAYPEYAEPTEPTTPGDPPMTKEELEAKAAELEAERQRLAAERAEFAESQRELDKKGLRLELEQIAAEGRIPPAHVDALVEFMAQQEQGTDQVAIEFGESAERLAPREFMRQFLRSLPKAIDYAEHAPGESAGDGMSLHEKAERARAYRTRQAEAGREISFSEAVRAVTAGTDQ
ncbi:MAG: hypothetical protein ACLFSR_03860 [Halomonas sp.]